MVESDQNGATRLTSKVDGIPAVFELRPITLLMNADYKILGKCFVYELAHTSHGGNFLSGQLCSLKEKNLLTYLTFSQNCRLNERLHLNVFNKSCLIYDEHGHMDSNAMINIMAPYYCLN